jgi:hypothetical protein
MAMKLASNVCMANSFSGASQSVMEAFFLLHGKR